MVAAQLLGLFARLELQLDKAIEAQQEVVDQVSQTLQQDQQFVQLSDRAAIAEAAKAKGITQVIFDRNGFIYHGRVKALADAVRKGGIKF